MSARPDSELTASTQQIQDRLPDLNAVVLPMPMQTVPPATAFPAAPAPHSSLATLKSALEAGPGFPGLHLDLAEIWNP